MADPEKVIPMTEEDALRGPHKERTILAVPKEAVGGFMDFIRERGVAGLLIGFVLGGALSKVTTSFSNDILNPSLAIVFGSTQRLADIMLGSIAIGRFAASVLDFLILALVVYVLFKGLGLDKIDKPKA